MLLAAGKGTRLAPRTNTTPKPLVEVGGRPLLEHILTFLRAGGIEDVVINLHHLGHLIEAHVGDGARFGLRVRYSWEDPILDTGGGIKRAESLLGGEPFVVANGDSLLDLSLRDVIDQHQARGGIATMVLRPDPEAARYGLVEVDAADRVRCVAGRPPGVSSAALRGFMFCGLHVLQPDIFSWMDDAGAYSITRVTYPRLLEADVPVYACVANARWINIDTPEALAVAERTWQAAPFTR
jgi:NDP-sugar pyrophosphorylase family protein